MRPSKSHFAKKENSNISMGLTSGHFGNNGQQRPLQQRKVATFSRFALRRVNTPWYVGKATKTFKQEALGPYQLNHYNDVLFDGRKGKPVMFIIAPGDNKKTVPAASCGQIETFLIQTAYAKNPEIRNRQQTKMPDWTIKGVVRPTQGKPTKTEQAFKTMMGIGKE